MVLTKLMYVESSEHKETSLKEVNEWVSKGVEVREGKFKGFEAESRPPL